MSPSHQQDKLPLRGMHSEASSGRGDSRVLTEGKQLCPGRNQTRKEA